jgi:hypothetical protein
MSPTRRARPRAVARRLLLPAAILVAAGSTASAQAVPREPLRHAHQHAWLGVIGDLPLRQGSRLALHAEAQMRRADLGATWQQALARGGLLFSVNRALRLGAGYAYVESWPYGESPTPARAPEHRLWQQATLSHAVPGAGGVSLSHRARFEQRWLGVMRPTGTGGAFARDDWQWQLRARYLARATVPLRAVAPALERSYLSLGNEAFVTRRFAATPTLLDQNRASILVGQQLGGGTRVEGGYLHQWLKRGGGIREHNHTIQLNVLVSAPLTR